MHLTEQNTYIGELRIAGKLFEHALNAVIFTISLSSSLKDGAEDIFWRFMLLNALTSVMEINLTMEYKRLDAADTRSKHSTLAAVKKMVMQIKTIIYAALIRKAYLRTAAV
jgi:hypothetical protein